MTTTQVKLKHLYWRAGFGLSLKEWEFRKNWTLDQAIDSLLFSHNTSPPQYAEYTDLDKLSMSEMREIRISKEQKNNLRKQERQLVIKQNANWILQMAATTNDPLLERMTLFWHGHFACETKQSKLAFQQLATLRKYALGNFRDLVLAIAKDPSMIRYLNNQQNKKKSPNENFARELLELFTIGLGNYTEKDIKEAARAFTGWSSSLNGEFTFRDVQHDNGQKDFMGARGNFNGDDIIHLILEQKETATFICTKIYRYFVNDKVNDVHVQLLSNHFYNSDYDIKKLMEFLFRADWFYAVENRGAKIKSPIELIVGLLRVVPTDFNNDLALLFIQRALGQMLFNPPNVAGWTGGRAWIDNSTLLLRLNLAKFLFDNAEIQFQLKDIDANQKFRLAKRLNASVHLDEILTYTTDITTPDLAKELTDFLLPKAPQISYKVLTEGLSTSDKINYTRQLIVRIMSLPEYQMC